MANLTRLSVLIADSDAERRLATAELSRELGARSAVQVGDVDALLGALKAQAFDLLICGERLGDEDGVHILRAARKLAPATRGVLALTDARTSGFLPEDVEAFELPFSHATLEGLLQRTASPQGGLWCEVPDLSLSDILQLYHQSRRSITVLLSGPIAGSIRLEAGEIVDAETENQRGMLALSRLLEAESGLIRTEPPSADGSRTIFTPFQGAVLEAAQKLDERRRDSLLGTDVTSVSSEVLRPAMTPVLHAHGPNPDSFLAPGRTARRRRRLVASTGTLVALACLGAAALHFQRRAAGARQGEAAVEPSALRAPQGSEAELEESSQALAPSQPLPARALAADTPTYAESQREPGAGPGEPQPASRLPRHPGAEAAAPDPARFALHISSRPSRATVTEGGRVLGKTPLTLTIPAASVASAPREFVLRLPGYMSSRISQTASSADVDALVVLVPRAARAEPGDGGGLGAEGDSLSQGAASRRRDLDIRMRR